MGVNAWTFNEAPVGGAASAGVTTIEGTTFCISDSNGDIAPGRTAGLFIKDTRVLSQWRLLVDGVQVDPLDVLTVEPSVTTFLARAVPRPGFADSTALVVRRRTVSTDMRESITVHNTGGHQLTHDVRLDVGADFADLFEVKEGRDDPEPQDVVRTETPTSLQLSSIRSGIAHHVRIRSDPPSAHREFGWTVDLPPWGSWAVTLIVDTETASPNPDPPWEPVRTPEPAATFPRARLPSPDLTTADANLAAVLAQSIKDLGVLRIFDPGDPGRAIVAAGAPWFMALFGRDSLLTSWMLMPFTSELAVGTLQTLAEHQGVRVNEQTEEEPGRILHEVRFGRAVHLTLGGSDTYYGSVDATPLFVMLLGELHRWGRHPSAVRKLLPHADRALRWLIDDADRDRDGFVEYERRNPLGLLNQGWKDSGDAVTFADGRTADPPVALAEVQGYTYAAFLARADLADDFGDPATARRWRDRAARLKTAFNERFWLPDLSFFALGLDRDKRPIDSITSNIGHCLWTGIVDEDKASAVAERLLSPEMFTGWGIRTLSSSMTAYNPMSYHNGSVWPHDTAICAAGLMHDGFVDEATRIAESLIDAGAHFADRLPELFCGFPREWFPARCPTPLLARRRHGHPPHPCSWCGTCCASTRGREQGRGRTGLAR
jgi:glycogen debranching enzyme